jgi:hypothetical protein
MTSSGNWRDAAASSHAATTACTTLDVLNAAGQAKL